MRYQPLDQTSIPWNRNGGHRWGAAERERPPGPMRPARPAPGVADQWDRYHPRANDQLVHRDNTPWVPVARVIMPGTGRASWAAAGPARPELNQRDVTYNPRAGNSRSRFLTDPRDRRLGLHTTPVTHSIGTVPRYVQPDAPRMRKPRQNRLSPARYTGQSYSQTTLTQGGR